MPETPKLKSGVPHALLTQRVGPFLVTEDEVDRLRFGIPSRGPAIWLCIAVVAVVCGAAFFFDSPFKRADYPQGDAKNTLNPLSIWAFIGGAVCLVVGFQGLGVSYTVDGNARSVVKRHVWPVARWQSNQLRAVSLTVTHHGPTEIFVLALEAERSREVIAKAGTSARQIALPAVAMRMAELLDIPLRREGNVVQADAEVAAALASAGPASGVNDGRDLRINCPACKRKNVAGVAFDLIERRGAISHKTTWVRCLACKTDLYSDLRADELVGLSADRLQNVIRFRVSMIRSALAVLAIVLCAFPAVGFVLSIVATLANRRTPGWQKPASRIALAIATVVTAIVTYNEIRH